MKFEIIVDSARNLIEICYKGDISYATWLQAQAQLTALEDGATLRDARILVADYTDATLASFSNEDMSKKSVNLVKQTMTLFPDLKVINIVPESLEYGLIRMLEGYLEGQSSWDSYLVKTRDECNAILQSLD